MIHNTSESESSTDTTSPSGHTSDATSESSMSNSNLHANQAPVADVPVVASGSPLATDGNGNENLRSPPPPALNAAVAGGHLMQNHPADERVDVHDSENVATPRAALASRHMGSDEDDDDDEETDNDSSNINHSDRLGSAGVSAGGAPSADRPGGDGVGHVVRNAPHDEAIPVNDDSGSEGHVPTPVAARDVPPAAAAPVPVTAAVSERQVQERGQVQEGRALFHGAAPKGAMMAPMEDDDNEEEEEEEEEDAEGEEAREATGTSQQQYRPSHAGQTPATIDASKAEQQLAKQAAGPSREYDPAKYARANAKATREIQELFKHILDYEPFVAELPAKLRPFVPDYIPAVGELDPFVKIPRPDGLPDGLGLYVIDEPAIPQSNPAVVQLELRATNAHVAGGAAQVVDSFEDAANRPEVIDRWINDVKKVHYKKPLPTVNYQKPMPEIDTLLQAWPQAFEDVLNSDVPFPAPGIDLDLEQYVRTLCAILDIPTYTSLIDSLHVMFTLYEEFRVNQHFQHE